MKIPNRSIRRHHHRRLQERAKWIMAVVWGYRAQDVSPRRLGKCVATRTPCSCWMCGNPRRHHAEVTIQERRRQQYEF